MGAAPLPTEALFANYQEPARGIWGGFPPSALPEQDCVFLLHFLSLLATNLYPRFTLLLLGFLSASPAPRELRRIA